MKKYYSTVVQELGVQVHAFKEARMLILFNENAPKELREYCVLHCGNKLEDTVRAGDVFCLGKEEYRIVFVGSEVQKNLRDLGHITLRFNGNEEGESLEGSLYLESKGVADVKVGDEIAIYRP
ncbi:PTS glucitol/sorbitol transporter subunit IIA [Mitsuokella sp. oral taxon 131]|uniref:PTS glucitol/sorbitol transporter subunit IIA n=1 Tax=Mitsuokella sp. oral taxon 131 TaxID=1321780 RepID=UPI0003ADC925|nr:PTS glucitol/sorbitol transporter subunit IIA [Mitsuokella sp. oral taxon 131]ERL04290.1 putative PTS system, glucitol/sorbitol-specific, IIA component [Mitsuokella sp. oral taxon 131 str. W9106]